MLRLRSFFLVILVLISAILVLYSPRKSESSATLRRLTNTPEQSLSLNPSLSDDGLVVAFESTDDLAGSGASNTFHALLLNLLTENPTFQEIGRTRAVSPALSSDGSKLAFASNEDLVGQNSDRNSEIYLFDGKTLRQVTHTSPESEARRLSDGNFQPSISGDGQFIAFASNRNLVGLNADFNLEIFLFETVGENITQLTASSNSFGATNPKISGDSSAIAFTSSTAETSAQRDLKLYDRRSADMQTLVADAPGLSLAYGRAISDDGLRIVYSSDIGTSQSQVFTFDRSTNISRQLTSLGTRTADVNLQATISGDGKRIAFATRRKVLSASDGGVELYLFDLPTAQITQITDAPASATAEVVSSLNHDGSRIAFNFPRVISGPVLSSELVNTCEIYLASLPSRALFGAATIFNAATKGTEPALTKTVAPGSIATIKGNSLAAKSEQAQLTVEGTVPLSIAGTTVFFNGLQAPVFYVSPDEITVLVPMNLSPGPAEVTATNSEGFQSKASINISNVAPGVFAINGQGHGEAIILNADTLAPGPFDPTNGGLRLWIFATGVRNASHVTVNIGGRAVNVETILSSQSLPGLDEIHAAVPAELRGAGNVTLVVIADGIESNPVTVAIGGNSLRDIMINEFLADPPDGLAGDANHDGVRDSAADEFVELVNSTTRDLDVSGYQLQTRGATGATDVIRHRFAAGTVLSAGTGLIVFGGGNPDPSNPLFGGSQIIRASTGGLSLINSGGVITLRDAAGAPVTFVTYGADAGLQGDTNQSLTRSPDITGNFFPHKVALGSRGNAFSPGTRVDGSFFLPVPGPSPTPTPIPTPSPGPSPSVTPVPSPSPTATATPFPSPAPSPPPPVVISEFRTRGPGGASDEFIELYNNSATPVDISGWRIKGSSSAGGVSVRLTIAATTMLPARGHFLAGNSGGYSGSVALDQTYTSGIANDGGLALTLPDDSIVDQVGLSAGSAYKEGMHLAPLPSDANQSYERRPGGANGSGQDLNDNFSDFQLLTPSDPQNMSSSPAPLPSPSPGPSGSPSPTATPTPVPSPSASPSPSPTVTPTPIPSPSPFPSPSPLPAPGIVISQIFGGGGNSSAPFRNDFIELFNSGQSAVSLAGWSVQYASATASSWSVTSLTPVLLAPGQYYLVQEASGGSSGAALPIPDVTGTIAMAASAGKVALVRTTTALAGACPNDGTIADEVGYGNTANCFRGAGPTPAPGNATAVLRGSNGCANTKNNSSDFATAAPNPRNSLSAPAPCSGTLALTEISAEYLNTLAGQKAKTLDSPMLSLTDALTSLREHFGFDDFREGQREVIGAILEGKDAVVVMPTGSGKSLCYQLPAMMLEGSTLVVSPLIALMKDQVDALHTRGLPATFINSSISEREQWTRIDALRRRQFKLVYIAPERFRSSRFLETLQSINVSLFAIDEAHCISTWGHDFRPDYLRLKNVIQSLGRVQTLALTATATPYVRSDIIQQLGLSKPETFVTGFDRPNLTINVLHTEKERQKVASIKRLAKTHDGSGIVYASTRKAVEQVARELQDQGLSVATYHAGLSDALRIRAQEDFMIGRKQMIVATNAFGMGIDKADIRFVAHYQMPGSIEAYYQEIGRAGRDGLPSSCVLLFNYADKNTHDFFIEGSYPSAGLVQDVYNALVSTGLKRIELSTSEIGKRAGIRNEMAVQSSLYLLERAGHIKRGAPFESREAPQKSSITGNSPASARRGARSLLLLDNAPATKLRINPGDVTRRAELERRKLREMIEFCYTEYCYRAHILDYFGDRHHAHRCGTCGNCTPQATARAPLADSETLSESRSSSISRKNLAVAIEVSPRILTEDETLRVRKILACAARMRGRFGKTLLASTLRGSAAKNVIQAQLNELSTYGILKDMRQDDILLYLDALVKARCLQVSTGNYPTVSITELGERVMRQQAQVELGLPQTAAHGDYYERDPTI